MFNTYSSTPTKTITNNDDTTVLHSNCSYPKRQREGEPTRQPSHSGRVLTDKTSPLLNECQGTQGWHPRANAWAFLCAKELRNEFTSEACFDSSGIRIGVDYVIADAGATGHFLLPEAPVVNKSETTNPLTIHLPGGDTLSSTNTCDVDIPCLPKKARRAHIVPGLAHSSLISIKVLCEHGCTVLYKGDHCKVYEGKLIWRSVKEPTTNLWVLPLKHDGLPITTKKERVRPRHTANNIHHLTSRETLVRFLHQCLFSPPKRTMVKAVENNQLATWPITADAVKKYLPDNSPATDKGSMK